MTRPLMRIHVHQDVLISVKVVELIPVEIITPYYEEHVLEAIINILHSAEDCVPHTWTCIPVGPSAAAVQVIKDKVRH